MCAACVWDEWRSLDGKVCFKSMAIITDGPPAEVKSKGHDRCPIFINESLIDDCLYPKDKSVDQIFEILNSKNMVTYNNQWV